jgi:hypothetical protein
MKIIRVLLADDHAIVRAGLRVLMETAEDMRIIGEAENGRLAVREAESRQTERNTVESTPLYEGRRRCCSLHDHPPLNLHFAQGTRRVAYLT